MRTPRSSRHSTISRDDILFVTDNPSGYVYFRNFGRTRRQGLDVDASSNTGPAPGFDGNIAALSASIPASALIINRGA